MPPFFRRILASGYAVVSLGYRTSGQAPFPACLHDCRAAVRWLRQSGAELGLDVGKIGVIGNSAGGHLALHMAVSHGVEGLEGEELGYREAMNPNPNRNDAHR